jgi:polyhydroxybutyrate depolymerase
MAKAFVPAKAMRVDPFGRWTPPRAERVHDRFSRSRTDRGSWPVAGLLLTLGLGIAGCSKSLPDRGAVVPGDYVAHLDFRDADSRRRFYRIHVPPHVGRSSRFPVVVVLHGAMDSARGIERRSGFNRLADREGLVVVYPNGYGFLGLLRHWNAGHCCGRAHRLGLDDVGLLDAVLDDVARRVDVDPERVYVVGESNGAMLAYSYAARRAGRVAAAGAVNSTIGSRRDPASALETIPAPATPVPMTIIHGAADRTIPFRAGPTSDGEVSWVSASDSAAFWVHHNDAGGEPLVTEAHGGRVVRSTWRGGDVTSSVDLYEIRDWGHVWPGGKSTGDLSEDDPLRGFDAASVLWQHFRTQRRRGESP